MAKPYADDLLGRVAAAIAAGESCRAISERFDIAPSTVVKWVKRLPTSGSRAAVFIAESRWPVEALDGQLDPIEP